MPLVELDEEVFESLQAQAEPLVDTPNSVLRRVLGLPPTRVTTRAAAPIEVPPGQTRSSISRRRKHLGDLVAESEYVLPILQSLAGNGGRAPTREVLDAVGRALQDVHKPRDYELTGNGNEKRWEARAHAVRLRMIDQGLLEKNSPRGLWTSTERGQAELAKALRDSNGGPQ